MVTLPTVEDRNIMDRKKTEVEHSREKEMHTLREEGREDEDKDREVVDEKSMRKKEIRH